MKTLHWFALVALLVLAGCASQTRPTRIIIQETRARNPIAQEAPDDRLPKLPEEPAIPAVPITVAPLPVSNTNPQTTPENQVSASMGNPVASAPAPASPNVHAVNQENQVSNRAGNPAAPATPAPSIPEPSATSVAGATSPFANAMTESSAKIKVLGIFFVASDMPSPTDQEISDFQKHLVVAQANYKKMLLGRDTFTLNSKTPFIYHSPNDLASFERTGEEGISKFTIELLKALNVDRNSLNDDLAVVVMNPQYDWPRGGGLPINGGTDKGAGIEVISSNSLDKSDGNFQGTLEHELGHSFGLEHTDKYGYSMDTGDSIMSYNHEHRWTGFQPPANPGVLIPEDIRALAENKNVFPNLYFDPKTDVPSGYTLKKIVVYGPVNLSATVPGYELSIDNKVVKQEPNYSLEQALTDYWSNLQSNPNKNVQAKFQGITLVISGKGFELYTNGKRSVNKPDWTYDQAMKDFLGMMKKDPESQMVGLYNGQIMKTN
jgi:Metallo-peptidase family M12B Reprolysin-like